VRNKVIVFFIECTPIRYDVALVIAKP
jgi:hypothetical protein